MRLESGSVRMRRVVVVDPDAVYVAGLEETLANILWTVVPCRDTDAAIAALAVGGVDAIWTEVDASNVERSVALLHAASAVRTSLLLVVTSEPLRAMSLATRLPADTFVFSKRDTSHAVRRLGEEHDRHAEKTISRRPTDVRYQ